jgi:hypothetical protein
MKINKYILFADNTGQFEWRENIIGDHFFYMVNFNMLKKMYIGQALPDLKKKTTEQGMLPTLFINQSIHKTEKFTLFNGNLHGNFLFVFATFLTVAKLQNISKMLWIKGPYVAVAREQKPLSHDSS